MVEAFPSAPEHLRTRGLPLDANERVAFASARELHHTDRVADHIGGALLTFGASGHGYLRPDA
jgi:hypothetical protein